MYKDNYSLFQSLLMPGIILCNLRASTLFSASNPLRWIQLGNSIVRWLCFAYEKIGAERPSESAGFHSG